MAGRVSGVTISTYSEQQPVQHDRASVLAGAENALFSANADTVLLSAEELPSVHEAHSREDDEAGTEDLEDDAVVYLTDSYRAWECHYLKRLAKQIHRLVCLELDRSEEALFMAFIAHDTNLDGLVRDDEVPSLLEAIERYAPGALSDDDKLVGKDGSISFLSLLRWYSGDDGGGYQETTTTMNVTSLAVGMLGSGYVGSDSRIDALDWQSLRANILGYRRLYQQLRLLKEERRLNKARDVERDQSLEDAMAEYYNALAAEFEGDGEHLFELFNEVDVSGNMLLETSEVEALLKLLDTAASPDDLKRYIAEINLADGPLSFASLIDWWDQARSVENSLVAEKGMSLIAAVKARSVSKSWGGFTSVDSVARKKWMQASSQGIEQLQAVRDAYIRTLSEVREYKMERDLRTAEVEAAKL